MSKLKKIGIFVSLALCLCLASAFMLIPMPAKAESVAQESVYGNYQGYKNWYYLEGDFDKNDMHRMTYIIEHDNNSYWKGYGWWNRIGSNLAQGADGGYDTVRAYRAPYDGALTIGGTIVNGCGEGDGVKLKIVHRKAAKFNVNTSDTVLYSSVLVNSDANVELSTIDALKNVESGAGDVFYFVVNANGTPANDNMAYNVTTTWDNMTDPIVEVGDTVFAKSMDFTGDYKLIVSADGLLDAQNDAYRNQIVAPATLSGDTENIRNVVYGNETSGYKILPLTSDAASYQYGGAGAGNFAVFYGHNFTAAPDAEVGLRYKINRDGLVDIVGQFTGYTATSWKYIRKTIEEGVNKYEIISTIACTGNSAANLKKTIDDAKLKNIPVKAGDEIYVLNTSSTYWEGSTAYHFIDYRSTTAYEKLDMQDPYIESPVIGDLTTEDFAIAYGEQGTDNWYKLYGKADGDFYKLDRLQDGHEWRNSRIDNGNTIWWKEQFYPSNAYDTMLMWQSPYNGSVTFNGYFSKSKVDIAKSDGVVVSVIKKTAAGETSTIYSGTYDRAFTKLFENQTFATKSGDKYFFTVGANVNSDFDLTVMKMHASFTKDTVDAGDAASEEIGDTFELPNLDYQQFCPDEQGENNWFATYGKPTAYMKMSKGDAAVGINWGGSPSGVGIFWSQNFAATGGVDAIMIWRAPFNGEVEFNGLFSMDDKASTAGGHDVGLKLLNKKALESAPTVIWENVYTTAFEQFLLADKHTVVSGEIYMFVVDPRIGDWDAVVTKLNAKFTKNEENPGAPPPDDIGDLITKTQEEFNSQFGEEQGANNWHYLYGTTTSKYYEMSWNGGGWQGSEPYCSLQRENQHPGSGEDAIRMWRAPNDGKVTMIGQISGSYLNGSDGIKFTAYIRKYLGAQGYSAAEGLNKIDVVLDKTNASIAFNIKNLAVTRGDMLFFAVNANGNNKEDSTKANLFAEFVKTADGVDAGADIGCARQLDTTGYYSATQGANGWYYAFGSYDKYTLMTFGLGTTGLKMWNGRESYLGISIDNQHPGDKYSSLRIFVAAESGKVKLEGMAKKLTSEGDGVSSAIYKNSEKIWSKAFAATDTATVPLDFDIEVVKGDRIVFEVNAGATNSNDGFLYQVDVYYTANGGDLIVGEDLSSFVKDVPYSTLLGVNMVDDKISEDVPKKTGCGAIGLVGTSGVIIPLACILMAAIVLLKIKRGKKNEKE